MCFWYQREKNSKVYQKIDTNSEISAEPEECSLPEHVDNAFLDRNVQKGILGFRYETKQSSFVVYSSIECKTFCLIMQLTPLKN